MIKLIGYETFWTIIPYYKAYIIIDETGKGVVVHKVNMIYPLTLLARTHMHLM